MKKIFNVQNLMILSIVIFAGSAIYNVFQIANTPIVIEPFLDTIAKSRSHYILALLQCCLGIVATVFPIILKYKARIHIPSPILAFHVTFLILAIFCGEVLDFYYHIPWWDKMLHFASGVALGFLGLSLIGLLNKSRSIISSIKPTFIAVYTFVFSLALSAIWEIYEFLADFILGTNMQRHRIIHTDIDLVGQEALYDTMLDLVFASVGALIAAFIIYKLIQRKSKLVNNLQVKRFSKPLKSSR